MNLPFYVISDTKGPEAIPRENYADYQAEEERAPQN
jgi:hypothetical protein